MKSIQKTLLLLGLLFLLIPLSNCKGENNKSNTVEPAYQDELYDFQKPLRFPFPIIDPNNPLTVNGVELGRNLFYDPILSGDNTQACESCHSQSTSFSDAPKQFSKGIDGIEGDKNSMALINLAWNRDFFWDGRSPSLEAQVLEPVRNPIEMHLEWKEAVNKLQASSKYLALFKKAFGTEQVDSLLVARAITQFLKTIVASDTKYHKGQLGSQLSLAAARGLALFKRDDKADCFHCHAIDASLFTSNYYSNPVQRFHNNGLDPEAPQGVLTGRALVTGDKADNGKFKAPTLINIALTAPYMHDGRFKTLEEVIEFYDSGVHLSSTLDPNMNIKSNTGVREFIEGKRKLHLSAQEKSDLVAFLKELTDLSVTTNLAYSKP